MKPNRRRRLTLNVLLTVCTSGPPYTFSTVGYFTPSMKLCGLNTIAYSTSPDEICGLWIEGLY